MKYFCIGYVTPGADRGGEYVVAEKEEDIIGVLELRTRRFKNSIHLTSVKEVSPESVPLSKLTVGDFIRIMSDINEQK